MSGDTRRYWTPQEDRLLLEFQPAPARNLRDLAQELGRTYYAVRGRRKALQAGHVQPAAEPCCLGCGAKLPEGRHHGCCERCRLTHQRRSNRRRYLMGSLSTSGKAGRRWQPWTEEDDRRVLQEPLTLNLARELGRTMKSCTVRRQRLQYVEST